MNDVDRWMAQIHELRGSMLAMECYVNALSEALGEDTRMIARACYASETEAFRVALMSSTAPEATVAAFERDVQRTIGVLGEPGEPGPSTLR